MSSDAEKKVTWIPISEAALRAASDYHAVAGTGLNYFIPSLAVECEQCGKITRLKDVVKDQGLDRRRIRSYRFTQTGPASEFQIDVEEYGYVVSKRIHKSNCTCGYSIRFTARNLRKPKAGCFIATATYGSPLAPEVMVFCQFRDDFLLVTKPGRIFVKLYYSASPSLALLISKVPFLRIATRACVLTPLLRLLPRRECTPSESDLSQ
jgi:hypothetical protein